MGPRPEMPFSQRSSTLYTDLLSTSSLGGDGEPSCGPVVTLPPIAGPKSMV